MHKYKITYWLGGNIRVCTIEAQSQAKAQFIFYMRYSNDDLISIEEIEDDN